MNRHTLRSLRGMSVVFVLGVLGVASVGAQQRPVTAGRMVVLLFDVGAMQPDDLRRAAESSVKFVDEVMTGTDLVSVVTIGSRLNVITDFTSNAAELKAALGTVGSTATNADVASSDVRLRALKTLCETLAPIQQKKAVLYFSSGMQRTGDDNGIEVREATGTCNRGNVSIYPVDARGLTAATGKAL